MGDHQEGSAALPVKRQELFQQYPGVLESSAPVGSSARISFGRTASARAQAHLLALAAGDLIGVFIKDTFNTKLAGGG